MSGGSSSSSTALSQSSASSSSSNAEIGGLFVFKWPIDWTNAVNGSWDFDLRELQLGFGPELIDPQQNYIVNGFEFETTVRDDEIDEINDFLDELQGRTNPFWLMGPLMEFKISADSIATEFIIFDQEASTYWQLEAGKYLAFRKAGEENQYRKITSIEDNLDGTETVTINVATETVVDESWRVYPIYLVRMADDTENIEVMAERCQRRSFKVVELPNDYQRIDSGLQLPIAPVYLYRFTAPFTDGDVVWHFTSHPKDVTIEADYLQSSSSSGFSETSSSQSSFSSVNSSTSKSSVSISSASSEGDGQAVTIISAFGSSVIISGAGLAGLPENHFLQGHLTYGSKSFLIGSSSTPIGIQIRLVLYSPVLDSLPIAAQVGPPIDAHSDSDSETESSSSATSLSSATSANSSSSDNPPSVTWLSVGLEHDRLSRSTSLGGTVALTGDYDTVEPLRLLIPMRMDVPLRVEILKTDLSLITPDIIFSGLIMKPSLEGRKISVQASEWGDVLDQKVPGFYIQRDCNYRLFEPATCKKDPTLEQIEVSIIAASGRSAVIAGRGLEGIAEDHFAQGFLKYGIGLNQRTVFITSSEAASGILIALDISSRILDELPITALASPGCDGTRNTCAFKFNNIQNFGGSAAAKENLTLVAIKTDTSAQGKK